MMLITESYRELNARLHKHSDKFGMGGAKWAMRAVSMCRQYGCKTILDYGCGKGALKKSLMAWDVQEYDPAIPGKNHAAPADLVVCTDVLEHIEPELLDSVLAHMVSMTDKRLLFCISTKLAKTHLLPDGRNPHLSHHDATWWKDKLGKYFRVADWNVEKESVYGEAVPIKELPAIETVSAMEEVERIEHMRLNSKRISARLRDDIPPHGRTAILVCGGPSLNMTCGGIPYENGDIFTVSIAHRLMIERGIVPHAHIDCDPREHKARQIGRPHPSVHYWLASCIHPEYLDKLSDNIVTLWHLHNGPETADALFNEIEPDGWLCIGGGSVGLRAISLLYSQGYRSFSVHGMDCSHAGSERYAGEHLGKNAQPVLRVRCGDRWFDSNLSLVDYARQFCDDLRLWEGASFKMHGEGLLQHMIKTSQTGELQ